jgi:hypothetical protein
MSYAGSLVLSSFYLRNLVLLAAPASFPCVTPAPWSFCIPFNIALSHARLTSQLTAHAVVERSIRQRVFSVATFTRAAAFALVPILNSRSSSA